VARWGFWVVVMRYLLGFKAQAIFRGLEAADPEHEARRAERSEKGGVHEVGTVVFTVSALGRRAF
jgi:hypothetical protein